MHDLPLQAFALYLTFSSFDMKPKLEVKFLTSNDALVSWHSLFILKPFANFKWLFLIYAQECLLKHSFKGQKEGEERERGEEKRENRREREREKEQEKEKGGKEKR